MLALPLGGDPISSSGDKPMTKRSRSSNPVDRLRLAVECLPLATRRAMLKGVRESERIIVGAYVDGGGVCPMLAAHRAGGPTNFLSFAKAWDRFARSGGVVRVASEREVRTLLTLLEASLEASDGMELDRAIAEHRSLLAARIRRTAPARRLAAEADPRGEIRAWRLSRRRRPRALAAA